MKHLSEKRFEELLSLPNDMTSSEREHIDSCSECEETFHALGAINNRIKQDASAAQLDSIDLSQQIMARIEHIQPRPVKHHQPFPFAILGGSIAAAIAVIFINYALISELFLTLERTLQTNNLFIIIVVCIAYICMKSVADVTAKLKT